MSECEGCKAGMPKDWRGFHHNPEAKGTWNETHMYCTASKDAAPAPGPLQVADRRHNDTHIRPCSPDCATCHPWQVAGRLALALQDMIGVAEFAGWHEALTGRQLILANAQKLLAEYQGRKEGTEWKP